VTQDSINFLYGVCIAVLRNVKTLGNR